MHHFYLLRNVCIVLLSSIEDPEGVKRWGSRQNNVQGNLILASSSVCFTLSFRVQCCDVQEYKRETLSSTLNRLGQTEQMDISVLNYFREAAHADALVAVELYEVGAVSTIVKSFRSGIQTPKV